jgi:cytosine/adenosine deaminase-related metal-dependent hydrolase
MFAEMQELSRNHPELPCEDLLQMATENGATALGLGDEIGVLKEGLIANMAVIPYNDSVLSVPEAIVHHRRPVAMLMIQGKRVFSGIDSIAD